MASSREHLLFRLWGPTASWGMIAVGEQRCSWTRPSRSAVLGIVAAALGYERADADQHRRLEIGLALAVRVDQPGGSVRDYHTTQTPQSESGRRWRSRRDELLGARKLNTILSDRDYLLEQHAVIALWRRANEEAPPLSEIEARLSRPVFALFLGRKASPPGLPIRPRRIVAETLGAAFSQFDLTETNDIEGARPARGRYLVPRPPERKSQPLEVWLSKADADAVGIRADAIRERTERRDGIRDRRTWTFTDRIEIRASLEEAT